VREGCDIAIPLFDYHFPMHKQPIPDVNSADVERVVRRDFPEEQFANAMEMLNEYGTERWHREQPRVWLAVLKLANCSVEALRRYVDAAKADYRDVLSWAEYPAYSRKVFGVRKRPSVREQRRLIDDDWAQYETWLRK
jgi:hypothetical protein